MPPKMSTRRDVILAKQRELIETAGLVPGEVAVATMPNGDEVDVIVAGRAGSTGLFASAVPHLTNDIYCTALYCVCVYRNVPRCTAV